MNISPSWHYSMKTEMMTGSLRQLDAEIDGESVWRAATNSAVWRGGGAAGPPWGDRVTPLRAARRRRELASSLSAGKLRTQVSGKRKRRVSEKRVVSERGVGGVSGVHRCQSWKCVKPSLFLLTEPRSVFLTVLYQYSLLQSTFRSPSIHVSSTLSEQKVACPHGCSPAKVTKMKKQP